MLPASVYQKHYTLAADWKQCPQQHPLFPPPSTPSLITWEDQVKITTLQIQSPSCLFLLSHIDGGFFITESLHLFTPKAYSFHGSYQ